jgi:hypothetical protein
MRCSKWTIRALATVGVMLPVGTIALALAQSDRGDPTGTIGPDLMMADLYSVQRFGRSGDVTAYAVATNVCNVGDQRVSWIRATNEHPVWRQGMFRLKDGRLEQIGMSWMRHAFYAVSGNFCGPCLDWTFGQELGVGCSDPSSANLNGAQLNMSAPSDLNAHTGYFPFPGTRPPYDPVIGRRLQVHDVDLDPDLNASALYFVEAHHIAPDEAAAGNGNNNASYRPVDVRLGGICSGGATDGAECNWAPDYGHRDCWACVGGTYPGRPCTYHAACIGGGSCDMDGACEPDVPDVFDVAVTGTTQREQPAVRAWQDHDPAVVETDIQVPGEGLFILAAKATYLRDGTWRYEYALQNLNSDRSAGSFSVPLPVGVVVDNVGFHDVDYHSGDPFDGTDWPATVTDDAVTWSTDAFDVDPNANALRFDTLYNFRFETNTAPAPTTVAIGLFKPGDPPIVTAETDGPMLAFVDCNDNESPDPCDVDCSAVGCQEPCGGSDDCNLNGVPDECDIAGETSNDCQPNGIPDECDPDWDNDGIPDDCEPGGTIGPDLVIADLYSVMRFGRTGDITAYGVGTNVCNLGDQRVSWIRTTNEHPVWTQAMFRLKDNRLEQIGMTWVVHGFYAVNGGLCGPCLDATLGQELGVGCSNPSSASLNGTQLNMSAPSDLNAHRCGPRFRSQPGCIVLRPGAPHRAGRGRRGQRE